MKAATWVVSALVVLTLAAQRTDATDTQLIYNGLRGRDKTTLLDENANTETNYRTFPGGMLSGTGGQSQDRTDPGATGTYYNQGPRNPSISVEESENQISSGQPSTSADQPGTSGEGPENEITSDQSSTSAYQPGTSGAEPENEITSGQSSTSAYQPSNSGEEPENEINSGQSSTSADQPGTSGEEGENEMGSVYGPETSGDNRDQTNPFELSSQDGEGGANPEEGTVGDDVEGSSRDYQPEERDRQPTDTGRTTEITDSVHGGVPTTRGKGKGTEPGKQYSPENSQTILKNTFIVTGSRITGISGWPVIMISSGAISITALVLIARSTSSPLFDNEAVSQIKEALKDLYCMYGK